MINYRVVRIQGINYQNAIEKVYLKQPSLSFQPFKVQHEAFLHNGVVHSGGFATAMNSLGNETHEIFYDCRHMQQTWAREKGVKFEESQWQTDILLAQLREIKPDVVFFQDIFSMPPDMRVSLRKLVPSMRLKVIQKGYPGETADLSDADILFVSSPILYERYRSLRPYLLYHSFNDSILTKLQGSNQSEEEHRIAFTFAGSVRAPERRYWMLRELLEKTDIQIWGEENKSAYLRYGIMPVKRTIKNLLRSAIKICIISLYGNRIPSFLKDEHLPRKLKKLLQDIEVSSMEKEKLDGLKTGRLPKKTLREMYPDRCHESLFGIDYYKLLRRSNIVFNLHSEAARNTVDNMKMFETTGVGACLITDTGSNMKDLFEEDKEVVTYLSVDEAIEKVKYLMDNENERKKIAEAGQSRTLREHTVRARCEIMHEIIQGRL